MGGRVEFVGAETIRLQALEALGLFERMKDSEYVAAGSFRFSRTKGLSYKLYTQDAYHAGLLNFIRDPPFVWNCMELLRAIMGHAALWAEQGSTGDVLSPTDIGRKSKQLLGESSNRSIVDFAAMEDLLGSLTVERLADGVWRQTRDDCYWIGEYLDHEEYLHTVRFYEHPWKASCCLAM